ncbi:uncharacterized protein [Equus przewalskii]|uniref:Uncharacterized protein n=1 Tax=Equus przewalskii TaxID=9798 RepID=A0ABM4M3I9_EQUPR
MDPPATAILTAPARHLAEGEGLTPSQTPPPGLQAAAVLGKGSDFQTANLEGSELGCAIFGCAAGELTGEDGSMRKTAARLGVCRLTQDCSEKEEEEEEEEELAPVCPPLAFLPPIDLLAPFAELLENLKYGNQALVPCTPSRLSQPRVRAWRRTTGKEGGPGSAELCPPCARRWRRRLANPGGPGLRPGGGRRACAAVAPAESGRAQPWRSQAWDAHGPSHSPERCRQGAWGGHNKVKAPSKSLQREETRRRQSPRKPRAAQPAAASCGGISANFKNTRIPLAAFARCIGRASSLPNPPCAAPGEGEVSAERDSWNDSGGLPLPCPTPRGRMGGQRERRQATPVMRSCTLRPRRGAGAMPQAGARGPRGARSKEKLAPSPGFPLRREAGSQNSVSRRSCWQSPGNAPATRVGAGTLRHTPPGLASQERAKGPSPSPAAARLPPPK